MTSKNLIITLTTLGFAVLCDARAAPQRSRSRSSVRRNVSKRSMPNPFATQPTVPINTLKNLITVAKNKGRLSDDDAKNMVNGVSAVSQPEDLTTIHKNLKMLVEKTIPEKKKKDTIARIKAVLNKAAPVDARADQAQQNQAQQDTIKELQDTIDQLTKDDTANKDTIDQLTKEKEQLTKQLKDAESEAKDDKDKIKRLERDIEDLKYENREPSTKIVASPDEQARLEDEKGEYIINKINHFITDPTSETLKEWIKVLVPHVSPHVQNAEDVAEGVVRKLGESFRPNDNK